MPLTYSQEEGVLTGAFTVPAPGRYMIQAAVTAAQMTRTTTQTLEFTMGGAPIQVAVGHGAAVEVDLAAHFLAGWDSVTLAVEDVSWTPEERLDITPGEAGVITISGLSTGEASFTVHAVDSLGQVWDIPGTVEVTFSLLAWLPLILAVLAALIAAAVLLRQRMCRLPGDFTVTCACGDGYSVETIAPPRGSSFTLYTLVMNSLDPGSGSAGMRRIVQAVRSARAELSSPGCRIRIARRASGRNRYRTYRLGRDGRALGGEVFRDDESGLTIEVEWLPPEE